MSTNEKLKKSLEDWKNVVLFNAQNDSLRAFTDATVSSSPDLDKASGWTLGASGAIAGLLISNVDKIAGQYFDISEIKLLLCILTISVLCGLAEKTLAVSCAIHTKVSDTLSAKLKEVLEDFEEHEEKIEDIADKNSIKISLDLDLIKITEQYTNMSPFYARWVVRRVMKRSVAQPEYASKRILGAYYNQSLWLFLQATFFIVFILAAVNFL